MTSRDENRDYDLTVLIQKGRAGDAEARDQLFSLVYNELRRIASKLRAVGKYGHTMQPTAVVNEAYLFFEKRFSVPHKDDAENREVFFRTIALAMRAILNNYWRSKKAQKRGGEVNVQEVPEQVAVKPGSDDFDAVDFLDLDSALDRLEARNRRWFSVVLHRYLGGRTFEEVAELMSLSIPVVKKDWQLARAWLRRELNFGD